MAVQDLATVRVQNEVPNELGSWICGGTQGYAEQNKIKWDHAQQQGNSGQEWSGSSVVCGGCRKEGARVGILGDLYGVCGLGVQK